MAQKLISETFRSVFRAVDKETLNWFPGHMGEGLKHMQHKLRSVDCIIEVHDARLPLSGRNTDFKYKISGVKPHILVLNKADLIKTESYKKIQKALHSECKHVVFTNCKNWQCKGVKSLFPLAQELINKSERFNRVEADDFCIMIIGVPNVGKSSLINALRVKFLKKGNATPVGAIPGITRSVMMKIKMSEKPLIYLLDTPGILTPKIPSTEIGLKLALCATIQDHIVGEEIIADYLLYWLNKNKEFKYVNFFNLSKANDNILEVLTHIAMTNNKVIKLRDYANGGYVQKPNLLEAAKVMIREFRKGSLGKLMLDSDLLQ